MEKITIQELAQVLVEKNHLDMQSASHFASEMFALILEHLELGEQVKVKGLGTFKIIGVGARESISVRTGERVVIDSHSKVSFTPDNTMKEIVNRPFSQFETVVLNDGIAFEDMKETNSVDEESGLSEDEPAVVEEAPEVIDTAVIPEEQEVQPISLNDEANEPEVRAREAETSPQTVEVHRVEEESPAGGQPQLTEDTPPPATTHGVLYGVIVLVLMAVSAFGGYQYGRMGKVTTKIVTIKDTVYAAMPKADTIVMESPVHQLQEHQLQEHQSPTPVAAQELQQTSQDGALDKWAQKDSRVRLGAYRIVGTAQEVTVLKGQSFQGICRAYLGPDMECYVEVYNDLPNNPTLKAGQVIKIPQLKLKKRK